MAALTPIWDDAAERQDDDGVRLLALLLLKVAVILANGIRARYSLSRGEKRVRAAHAF